MKPTSWKFFLFITVLAVAFGLAGAPVARASDISVCASGCAYTSIQAAIDAAAVGDVIQIGVGIYPENVQLNKAVSLVGVGDTTIIRSGDLSSSTNSDNKSAIEVSASGAADAPIFIKNLKIETIGRGIKIPDGVGVSYLTIDGVNLVGNDQANDYENSIGLLVERTTSLTNLTVTNSSFNDFTYGWYVFNTTDSNTDVFSDIMVTNSKFNSNMAKGLYIEKMSNALFENVEVKDNGLYLSYWNKAWNAGFDINLKFGTFANITLKNLTVTGNGLGVQHGAGLLVKARDDGATYGANPATLSDVTIEGGVFSGNERGVRLGEPNKNNATPTHVVIRGAKMFGNNKAYAGADGSAYGDLINCTLATPTLEHVYFTDGTSNVLLKRGDAVIAEFAAIQPAIDYALAGDTVVVPAGEFKEQITITKNLTLLGAGRDLTKIVSPDALAVSYTTPSSQKAIVAIKDADATIDGFTIDGAKKGNANYKFVGVAFRNAGGKLLNSTVVDVSENPLNGNQHGNAVYSYNDSGAARSIEMAYTRISGFQKNATAFNGDSVSPLALNIHDNDMIMGVGATSLNAQNGIQVWAGKATGVIANNTISGITYTGENWSATGILVISAEDLTISNNTISDTAVAIVVDPSGLYGPRAKFVKAVGNKITLDPAGSSCTGMGVAADNTVIQGNVIQQEAGSAASPACNGISLQGAYSNLQVVDNRVEGLSGNGLVYYYESEEPTSIYNFTVSGIHEAQGNLFKNNEGFGVVNMTPNALNVEYNSWGSYDGPAGGDGISGLLDADPWTYASVESASSAYPLAADRLGLGQTIKYTVKLDAQQVNTADLTFGFNKDLLTVTAINRLWDPAKDAGSATDGSVVLSSVSEANASGAIRFVLTTNTPLTGADQPVFEVVFQGKGKGSSTLAFTTPAFGMAGQSASSNIFLDQATDGSVEVYGVYDVTGRIDLQGRANDTGAQFKLDYSAGAYAFATPFVSTVTDWFGAIQLTQVVENTYALTSNAVPGYIDLTTEAGRARAISAATTLNTLLLLGGDANNDEAVGITDAGVIGGKYGQTGACTADSTTKCPDINGDGKVNILDLAIMGGNFDKNKTNAYTAYVP